MYAESTQVLLSSLMSLQSTAQYSDLTIFCGNKSYPVHKAVVCPRSPFFAAACKFGNEALRNEVTLPEDEPELVQLMIDYLYQLDYHVKETEQANSKLPSESGEQPFDLAPYPVSPVAHNIEMFEDLSGPSAAPEMPDDGLGLLKKSKKYKKKKQLSWSSDGELTIPEAAEPPLPPCEAPVEVEVPERRELRIHAQMYSLADKYGILDLKEVAMDKFAEEVSEHWENQGFLRAIEVVYTSTVETDKGLRKVVVEAIREHKHLLENNEVENCIKNVGGLAFDLLKCVWFEDECQLEDV